WRHGNSQRLTGARRFCDAAVEHVVGERHVVGTQIYSARLRAGKPVAKVPGVRSNVPRGVELGQDIPLVVVRVRIAAVERESIAGRGRVRARIAVAIVIVAVTLCAGTRSRSELIRGVIAEGDRSFWAYVG